MRRWILLLIGFLCGYAVSFVIHRSSVSDKMNELASALLPAKKWNWCPLEVTKLMITKSSQEISDTVIIDELCNAPMSMTLPAGSPGRFSAILRAQNKKGEVTFLEYDSTQKLFRTESQVFRSAKFEKFVSKVLELP